MRGRLRLGDRLFEEFVTEFEGRVLDFGYFLN
jgi:hypothetical protein